MQSNVLILLNVWPFVVFIFFPRMRSLKLSPAAVDAVDYGKCLRALIRLALSPGCPDAPCRPSMSPVSAELQGSYQFKFRFKIHSVMWFIEY